MSDASCYINCMIITYHGVEFFRVQVGDTVIALNPPAKDSKFKSGRFGADICFVTLNHQDMNGVSAVTLGEKKPFVIEGPGEYEVRGVFAKGMPSPSLYGGEKGINTIYSVTFDGLHLVFLGALVGPNLPASISEELDEVDLLFLPIGGQGVLSPSEAEKISVTLEPKLIIPMHYGAVGLAGALKTFLKEGGAENTKGIDKLTLKRKDLDGKEGEIVVLTSST